MLKFIFSGKKDHIRGEEEGGMVKFHTFPLSFVEPFPYNHLLTCFAIFFTLMMINLLIKLGIKLNGR